MGRPKKTEIQKLADKARALGIDLSDIDLPTTPTDTEEDKVLEAEAVILYFDIKGVGFRHQICPVCGNEFAYKYKVEMSKMRCSNRCRRKELESRNIPWSPGKPLETRWAKGASKGYLPLIVPPEALQAIREAMSDES